MGKANSHGGEIGKNMGKQKYFKFMGFLNISG